MMNKLVCGCVGVAMVAGCVEGGEAPVSERASEVTTVTYNLDDGTPTVNRPWDSGETEQLSPWQGVLCSAQSGTERLLVKLTGWRERSGNADNFVAKLRATCRNYEYDGPLPYEVGFPVVDQTETVFTSNFREETGTSEVEIGGNGDFVPVGIRVKFNDFDGYLKDFAMLKMLADDTGLISLQADGYAMGLSGDAHDLVCPTDYALTGVEVRYSTNKGKVRVIRGKCSLLVHH